MPLLEFSALKYADLMQSSASEFVTSIKNCAKLKDTVKLQLLLAEAAQIGLLQSNVYVGSTFVDTYARCDNPEKAEEVHMLCMRSVVTWSTLIAGYVHHGCGEAALDCYEKMLLDGVCPNAHTFSCVLKACASIRAIDKGIRLHSVIEEMECVRSNAYICNTLMDMYDKCDMKVKARYVFNNNPVRDVLSWTNLVAGYIAEGQGEEALISFKKMQSEGVHPNAISFTCILRACTSVKAIMEGREFHAEIERKGLLESNRFLGSVLVNMYVKCGLLEKAQEVFDRLPIRENIVWTALMVGYEGSTSSEQALKLFSQMQVEGVVSDLALLTCSLKACGSIGASYTGKELHAKIAANGLLKANTSLGNALVGMYAECGLLSEAQEAFDSIRIHSVALWTILITAFAQLEKVDDVICLFDRMLGEGRYPDPITILTVVNACSFSGLVEKGKTYFEVITEVYGIAPTLRYHSCMLDLHGRAGQLKEASSVAKWGDLELGRCAFGQSLQVNNEDYVYMGNILANA